MCAQIKRLEVQVVFEQVGNELLVILRIGPREIFFSASCNPDINRVVKDYLFTNFIQGHSCSSRNLLFASLNHIVDKSHPCVCCCRQGTHNERRQKLARRAYSKETSASLQFQNCHHSLPIRLICRLLITIGNMIKIAITRPMLMNQGTPKYPRTICRPILKTSEAPKKI